MRYTLSLSHGLFFATLGLIANFQPTSAVIYVTQPIATTTYTAGQNALATWIDDGHKPRTKHMGPVTVHLYEGNDVSMQHGSLWGSCMVSLWNY